MIPNQTLWKNALLPLLVLLSLISGCMQKTGAAPPTTPHATALDEAGSYLISIFNGEFSNDRGKYSATVYYPTEQGQYPAVAFSPGLGATKEMYKAVGNHLASHGYVVLIFTVPMPLTLSTVQHEAGFVSAFEFLSANNEDPESLIYARVNLDKLAIIGHSLGGAAATRAGAAMQNLSAIVSLAPAPDVSSEDLLKITAPIQFQATTLDCITGDEPAISYYETTTASAKMLIDINGGNHIGFNDVDSLGVTAGQNFDCKPVIDLLEHQQRLSRRYYTAWFDYYLKGDSSVASYLFGADGEQDLLSELLTRWQFASR